MSTEELRPQIEEDLTTDPKEQASVAQVAQTANVLSQLPVTPLEEHLQRSQEATRTRLAQIIVYSVPALAGGLLIGVLWGRLGTDQLKDVSLAVLTPVITLASVVIGFYFGERRRPS